MNQSFLVKKDSQKKDEKYKSDIQEKNLTQNIKFLKKNDSPKSPVSSSPV